MTNINRHTLKVIFWIGVTMHILLFLSFINPPEQYLMFIAPIILGVTTMTIVFTIALLYPTDDGSNYDLDDLGNEYVLKINLKSRPMIRINTAKRKIK